MASLVPQQYLPQVQSLLEFPDERIQDFLKALAEAGSKFNLNDLAVTVSERSRIPRRIVEGVVNVLAGLYAARKEASLPKFIDEQVYPAFTGAVKVQAASRKTPAQLAVDTAPEAESPWIRLRPFLMDALVMEDTLGTAAKAGPVMTEHERIFVDARVLTDVRPIFHSDLPEKPKAAVLVHMLRITTRDIFGKEKAQYFALDTNDVRFIKQLMDRAIKKEEVLRDVMGVSGVNVIVPKEFF